MIKLKKKLNGSMGFISCYGDIILEDLKDLYFLCADFKLNKAGLKMVEFISTLQMESPLNEQEILSHYAGILHSIIKCPPKSGKIM